MATSHSIAPSATHICSCLGEAEIQITVTDFTWLYIIATDVSEARALGRILVERRLAACANIFPAIESIYEWQGELTISNDAALIVKTRTELLPELIAQVKLAHSYECPCIVALPINSGNDDYLEWLRMQTCSTSEISTMTHDPLSKRGKS